MESVYRPKLTPTQVADLQDPEKLRNWPDPITKARTEYVLQSKKPGEAKTLTPADVELINQRFGGASLTTQDLHDLMDPEKRKNFPDEAVKARAKIFYHRRIQMSLQPAKLHFSIWADSKESSRPRRSPLRISHQTFLLGWINNC